MGCLANDVAPIQVKIPSVVSQIECITKKGHDTTIIMVVWFHRLSVYQRRSSYDYYNGTDRYLVRIMECVTFDIDLAYERVHIAWVVYKANLLIFYSYLMESVCDLFGNDLLNRYDMF